VQVTDTHLFPKGVSKFTKENGTTIDLKEHNYNNKRAFDLLKKVVEEVKPHIAILTGDIIDGRPFGQQKRNDWLETFGEFTQILVDNGVYWTFTPGNHDDDGSPWTREEMLKIYSLKNCLSREAKNFNHTLTVGPSENQKIRLWLFDSGENSPDPKIKYTPFDSKAVEDYANLSKSEFKEEKEKVLGLAFFHIPLPEYAYLKPIRGDVGLFDAALTKGNVPAIARWAPWLVRLTGLNRVVGSSKINTGLFDHIQQSGNIVATFCGHDHFNDAVYERNGVYLCYGRVSSWTPPINWEGDGGDLPFGLGLRVIEVDMNEDSRKCATWIHEDSGGYNQSSYLQMYPPPPAPASCIVS